MNETKDCSIYFSIERNQHYNRPAKILKNARIQ